MNPETADDHSLLAAFLVDALDAHERDVFAAHLEKCESCRDEAADLAEPVAGLADAQAATPPLSLRSDVMAQIRRTPQASPSVLTPRVAAARRRRWVPVGAVAASLIAIAGVGIVWGTRDAPSSPSALERDIVMLSSAPDAHSMELGLGSSHLVMSDHMDEVAVMGHGIPMPADGMEYQLWFVMADGSAVAGPTFMPDKGGDIMALAEVEVSHIAAFSVTVEPHGGSSAPTGAVIASADV